jgi:hypothetical protein
MPLVQTLLVLLQAMPVGSGRICGSRILLATIDHLPIEVLLWSVAAVETVAVPAVDVVVVAGPIAIALLLHPLH